MTEIKLMLSEVSERETSMRFLVNFGHLSRVSGEAENCIGPSACNKRLAKKEREAVGLLVTLNRTSTL